MTNPFFKNHGPFKIKEILEFILLKQNMSNDDEIHDVKDLVTSSKNDLTFFHNKNYAELAKKTKATIIILDKVLDVFMVCFLYCYKIFRLMS